MPPQAATSRPFLLFTGNADMALGRANLGSAGGDPSRPVRVGIVDLSHDKLGIIICHSQDAPGVTMDVQPIFASVVDELFFYESNEVYQVVILTIFQRGCSHHRFQATFRFTQPLDFHECVRYVAEAKAQLSYENNQWLQELSIIYTRHFRWSHTSRLNVPAPLVPYPVDSEMEDVMDSASTSPANSLRTTTPVEDEIPRSGSPTTPIPTAGTAGHAEEVITPVAEETPSTPPGGEAIVQEAGRGSA